MTASKHAQSSDADRPRHRGDATQAGRTNGVGSHRKGQHSVRTDRSSPKGAQTPANGAPRSARDRWVARPIADVKHAVEGPVVRNAASLYGTTIVTSILGF